MRLQSSSMAAIQMTSLVSMKCWACLSLPLVMGPSSASWSLSLVVSSSHLVLESPHLEPCSLSFFHFYISVQPPHKSIVEKLRGGKLHLLVLLIVVA